MNKYRKKVRDQLDRDDFFMGLAFFVAADSQNSRQHGAVLVSDSGELLSVTHDGVSKIVDATHFPSAEIKALLATKTSAQCGTLYLTHTPGYYSAMAIVAAMIKRVVYFPTKKIEENTADAFQTSHIRLDEFPGNLNWMRDYMKSLDMLGIFGNQNDK